MYSPSFLSPSHTVQKQNPPLNPHSLSLKSSQFCAMDGVNRSDNSPTPTTALSPTIFIPTTPSDDNRYFTQQALRAGFLRSETMVGSDSLREAIQRERDEILRTMEKERIREEIIAGEVLRRRELEAEVRRELGLENDLGIRRGDGFSSLFPKSALGPPMWPDQRVPILGRLGGFGNYGIPESMPLLNRGEVGAEGKLPFQRKPEAVWMAGAGQGQGGNQVTFLAKSLTTNLAGTKRNASAVGRATDNTKIGLKKQKNEGWNCALCKVVATCEQGLLQHFQGRKHKAKEAALRPKTALGSYSGSTSSMVEKSDKPLMFINNTPNSNPKNRMKQEVLVQKKPQAEEAKKKRFKFWCADCKVGCHSVVVMNNHVKGKKHVARMQGLEQLSGLASAAETPDSSTDKQEEIATEEANKEDTEDVKEELVGSADGVEGEGEEDVTEAV